MNSKLHAVTDGDGKPLILLLSEGQMSDHKGARLMLDALPHAKSLTGDRGYGQGHLSRRRRSNHGEPYRCRTGWMSSRLIVYPLIAGEGKVLFATTEGRRGLKIRKVEQLQGGGINLIYVMS